MKLLTISDNVLPQLENSDNLLRQYGDCDLVVSCGDMPAAYLEYIVSVLNVPLLYVRGNHDVFYEQNPPGGENLHGQIVRYKGLTFAGLEGCIRYNREPIQYSDTEMYVLVLKLWRKVLTYRWLRRRGIDVLVTHSPPRDIHDLTDRAHRGFKALNLAIRLYKPRYLLHGHVDTYDSRRPTQTRVGETQVININPVKYLTIDLRR